MKLASFCVDNRHSWGVIGADVAIDVGVVLEKELRTLREAIAADAYDRIPAAAAVAPIHALADIEWLPVIPQPGKILCIGLNYEDHRLEAGRERTGHPAVFTRFADSQLAHGADIVRPRVSTALDYEGELAVIIGKAGRHIGRDQAMAHVAGYACYNDATVRDWQRHTIQFTPGKNFPRTGGFGPWMVTADEIADVGALRLETRVNGATLQSAALDQLIFPIPVLIEYCSAFTPLEPGDVIVTGTPGGVGFKRDPQLFLQPGDLVEVEISQVGLLANGVVDEA